MRTAGGTEAGRTTYSSYRYRALAYSPNDAEIIYAERTKDDCTLSRASGLMVRADISKPT